MPKQNRKSIFSILVLTFLITSVIFLISSCGNNLFGKEEYKPKNITEMLELAETNADYDAIIAAAEPICTDADDEYDSDAQNLACSQQAEALSYRNGVDLFSTLIDIQEVVSNENASIYDVLSLRDNEGATYEGLSESAQLYNQMAASGTLTDAQEVSRGIVNTYSLIALIEERYVITVTGRLVNRNDIDYETDFHSFENLDNTVNELQAPNANYAENAVSGFQSSGSLSAEQEAETDQVDTTVDDMIRLRDASRDGAPVTIGSTSYDFSGASSSGANRDTLVDQALTDIFENDSAVDALSGGSVSGRID